MFFFQLWFWIALLNALGIVFLTASIHGARARKTTFSLRLTQQESAIAAHKRAFRVLPAAVNLLRAAKFHTVDHAASSFSA